MKLHFFHLMPYRFLPDDFTEKHRSVWVDVDSALFDPVKGHQIYNENLDELEYASQLGFDGICVNEHHQNAYGLMPSPNLMAASLARRTEKSALVVLGNSLALYNPPVRVAEEFAMLDCISGGRLVAGFPVGTSMDTNFCYGQTPADLREKYQEAHDLIVQAWTRPEVFSFNGKFTQLRYVNIWPRPIQKPHPPIWIPGGGSVETWEWVARHDYMYCYLSYFGHQRGLNVMKGYWDEVERQGRDKNPYRAGFLQFIAVAESDEQAEKDYAEHAEYFYNRCLRVYPGFADAPGYRTMKTVRAGLTAQFERQTAQASAGALTWKNFVDQGYILAGSPESVAQQLEEAAKALNVGHMMVLLQFGSMPPDLVRKNTELFAKEVMPRVRPLFEEYEDRWWINPLPDSQRMTPQAMAEPAGAPAGGGS
ncbi:MAG: LLM class flavin-dependent oxidoreductase [Chloroflexi bacterium]|nr:LLM class flavin-dependent oxidoreductase [Chloroflexota bacterium]